ncbi:MAG: hypothetical protein LBQ91_06640 [Oscillospiraceae bacterium]|jgi:hypothetical protein|nr:hypothetical protein [Oscillospiraceae bacterium]
MFIENSGGAKPQSQKNAVPDGSGIDAAPKSGSYLRGFAGALAGAIIGAIPWALVGLMGWIIAYLGLLIGFCACRGYRLLKGRGGGTAAVLILAAILVGVIAGTFGSYTLQVLKAERLTFAGSVNYVVNALKTEPADRLTFIKSLGVGVAFAVLGCLEWLFYKAKQGSGTTA